MPLTFSESFICCFLFLCCSVSSADELVPDNPPGFDRDQDASQNSFGKLTAGVDRFGATDVHRPR
jgi:hypothetical protein